MDGGKVLHWNKLAWAALTVASGFAFWHIVLGQERSGFAGLRDSDSLAVLGASVAFAVVSIGTWAYFRIRYP